MPPRRNGPIRLLLLAALLSQAGCGGGNSASVSGTVTLGDKPLGRGTVTFHPAGGGPLAYGQIGSDGSYSLQTGDRMGLAEPGTYAVTVVATAAVPDPNSGAIGKRLTPLRYGDPGKTELRFEVKSGSNRIDLRLKEE